MYPEITGHVRDLIKFRYRLIPYIYDLLWKVPQPLRTDDPAHVLRLSQDDRCFEENDDMLLGPSLLVAAVVEPGARARGVYLPAGDAWYDFWTGDCYEGGQEIVLPAPWIAPPCSPAPGRPFRSISPSNISPARRSGGALPSSRTPARVRSRPPSTRTTAKAWTTATASTANGRSRSTPTASVTVAVKAAGRSAPTERDVILRLPRLELRRIIAHEGAIVSDRIRDGCREVSVRL